MKVPYIPADAPFSGDQRTWLSGFFAGLHSQLALGENRSPASADAAPKEPVHILYGTQTGNSEQLANEAASLAEASGLLPTVASLDDVSMEQLAQMTSMICVISTYGEGDMPDSAELFWDALSASTAPRLETLRYGVLALGDTSYEHFCRAGKLLDTRLEQLGARRIAARLDCDVDYEEPAAAWLQTAISDVGGRQATLEAPPAAVGWSRKNPYRASLIENRRLSGPKSGKEIRHIVFDLGDSDIRYEAGDAIGVIPVNSAELVDLWLKRLGVAYDTILSDNNSPLGDRLLRDLEICTPSRELIDGIARVTENNELTHALNSGDSDALQKYLWGKDALDLLELAADAKLDPEQIISWLKPLQYRAYSISSSPNVHTNEVHLTVATVRWTYNGRAHGGVCSTFLADLAAGAGEAGIFAMPNKTFRVPDDGNAPVIMVGPGTGVAPFRAFLEERRFRGAAGVNWLFFGDQHREHDFIYEEEISEMSSSGLLTRLDLAFSRDQSEKIYVQHRMLENGRQLFSLLEDGGYFFVCGDASRMAKDVDAALHEIVATHGQRSADEAATYINDLKRSKRYVRDVY